MRAEDGLEMRGAEVEKKQWSLSLFAPRPPLLSPFLSHLFVHGQPVRLRFRTGPVHQDAGVRGEAGEG